MTYSGSDASNADLDHRLRAAYAAGSRIPEMLRVEFDLDESAPIDVMMALMRAFDIQLSDVACIDGWWPSSSTPEVSDEKLDRLVRLAIEERRTELAPE